MVFSFFNTMTTALIEKQIPKIPEEAMPFYYKAGKKGVFFVHGFTDSLCRVNTVAKYLSENGVTTKGVLLPGHAQTCEELARTNPDDWYSEVKRGVLELSKDVDEIYLVGISFGGNLALKLAAEKPTLIKGVVCIETPMRIHHQEIIKFVLVPIFAVLGLKNWRKKFLTRLKHPDKKIVFKQGVLEYMPVINIRQIINFLERRQGFLRKVKTKVLLIQSKKSSLLDNYSAQKIYDLIPSEKKEIFYIDNVYHAFLTEAAKRKIFARAMKFFDIEL